MQAVSKINFPGWGWGGWLGYMKIKPTQPQLGLGLAELGNTPLEIEVKSVKGYWSHHSQGRHASRG